MARVEATTYEQTFVVLNMDVRTAQTLKWTLGMGSGVMEAKRFANAAQWSPELAAALEHLRSSDDPHGAVYRALETALSRLPATEGK